MCPRLTTCLAVTAIALVTSGVGRAAPNTPLTDGPAAREAQKKVERGLTFLQADAAKWRKDRKCATCHHGALTVWALAEAKSQGYMADTDTLTDMTKWTKERLKDIDKPRDTRVGWNMVNTPALYLTVMDLAVPKQSILTTDERNQIVSHLLRHQEEGGFWAWSIAPAKNRAPPFFESDEGVTLLAYTALGPHVPADPNEKSAARDGQEKAAAWLEKNQAGTGTQVMALRLFRAIRSGSPVKEQEALIASLLNRQNKDGGWGQDKDLASDAYATGQALYFLRLAGVDRSRAEILRGVSFLVAQQRDDGSWPMSSRAHPGEKAANNPVPITYFSSAWATLGLLRCVD